MSKSENMSGEETKSAMLRARCEPELKEDVATIARFKMLDEADVIRIACARLVQQFKAAGSNSMML
jgi:hypothetical protein